MEADSTPLGFIARRPGATKAEHFSGLGDEQSVSGPIFHKPSAGGRRLIPKLPAQECSAFAPSREDHMANLDRRRFALGAGAGLALLLAGCREKAKDVKSAQPAEPQKPVTIAPASQKTTSAPQQQKTAAPQVLRSGRFNGVGAYRAQGDIQIVRNGNVTKLILASNFSFQGAPDPKLGFGNNGYKRGTLFSKLNRNSGAQEYVLPASVDLSKHNEVWIWCERFNVALAVAKLS
ncbi:MAG: DM13 domain-containing protein [Hyphomicrobiaceae bacterium]|nr:MAG: DM13 domain-containing protein [Hyphomicrobiaceae bacterium]